MWKNRGMEGRDGKTMEWKAEMEKQWSGRQRWKNNGKEGRDGKTMEWKA